MADWPPWTQSPRPRRPPVSRPIEAMQPLEHLLVFGRFEEVADRADGGQVGRRHRPAENEGARTHLQHRLQRRRAGHEGPHAGKGLRQRSHHEDLVERAEDHAGGAAAAGANHARAVGVVHIEHAAVAARHLVELLPAAGFCRSCCRRRPPPRRSPRIAPSPGCLPGPRDNKGATRGARRRWRRRSWRPAGCCRGKGGRPPASRPWSPPPGSGRCWPA